MLTRTLQPSSEQQPKCPAAGAAVAATGDSGPVLPVQSAAQLAALNAIAARTGSHVLGEYRAGLAPTGHLATAVSHCPEL